MGMSATIRARQHSPSAWSANCARLQKPQLLHDVANVNLDGALAHLEFVGNELVGESSPEVVDDLSLARCQAAPCRKRGGRVRSLPWSISAARMSGRRSPSRADQAQYTHRDIGACRRRDIALDAEPDEFGHHGRLLLITEQRQRNGRLFLHQLRQLTSDTSSGRGLCSDMVNEQYILPRIQLATLHIGYEIKALDRRVGKLRRKPPPDTFSSEQP